MVVYFCRRDDNGLHKNNPLILHATNYVNLWYYKEITMLSTENSAFF